MDEIRATSPACVPAKKKASYWLVAVVSAVAVFLVTNGLIEAILHHRASTALTQQLAQLSSQLNAGMPQQIDEETRLDKTLPGPANRFTYLYTLVNLPSTNFNRSEFEEGMKTVLLNGYKTNQGMKGFRKAQVELHYIYRDRDGNEVATIVVSPKDF